MSTAREELALAKIELMRWQVYALIVGLVVFIAGLAVVLLVTKTRRTSGARLCF